MLEEVHPLLLSLPRPLSLCPNEKLLNDFVGGRIYARLIVESWNPASSLKVTTLPAADALAIADGILDYS
jgi:hypothetical protein